MRGRGDGAGGAQVVWLRTAPEETWSWELVIRRPAPLEYKPDLAEAAVRRDTDKLAVDAGDRSVAQLAKMPRQSKVELEG